MQSSNGETIYDDFIAFIFERISAEDILAFQVSEEEQEHAIELLEKSSAGILSEDEADELRKTRDFDRFIGLLKAHAMEKLHS